MPLGFEIELKKRERPLFYDEDFAEAWCELRDRLLWPAVVAVTILTCMLTNAREPLSANQP